MSYNGVSMRWKLSLLAVLAAAGYLAATAATRDVPSAKDEGSAAAWFTLKGKVTRVVDGDTLIARIGRRSERVRLIGIDTPEIGACFSQEAKTAAQRLVGGRKIRLIGDRTQTRRDRYNRLLAYVQRTDGLDLGRQLLLGGYGIFYLFNKPFARLHSYLIAEATARSLSRGIWGPTCLPPATTSTTDTTTTTTTDTTSTSTTTSTIATSTTTSTSTTTTTTSSNCAPSYPDVCIPPPPPDLDCGQIPYQDFRVIYTVPFPDPHRFDGDRDGIGCES